jgi:hypothetical protein
MLRLRPTTGSNGHVCSGVFARPPPRSVSISSIATQGRSSMPRPFNSKQFLGRRRPKKENENGSVESGQSRSERTSWVPFDARRTIEEP